ncbi:MAG: acetylglutamate kinase [Dehalococcoidia bacterium]
MSGPLVIKVGGSTLGSADTTYADIAAMARAGDIPVVVHGGGAEAGRWLDRMGIPSRFERGLRVTDEEVLPVVVAVFAGLVNKQIVAAISAAGAPAVGLSGADGGLVECTLAPSGLGLVGEPVKVNAAILHALRDAGFVPVVSPIAVVPGRASAQLVNVNADTVAGCLAAAVAARELVFLSDVPGVTGADGAVVRQLTAAEAKQLIADGVATGGMVPKLEACLAAAALGVRSRIVDGRQGGAIAALQGTSIVPDAISGR